MDELSRRTAPLAKRIEDSVDHYRKTGRLAVEKGGVTKSELRAFFDRTPGISTSSTRYRDLLADAYGLVRVRKLSSFVGISVFRVPVFGDESPPVNVLLCGEYHDNRGRGRQLMRYIMGQVGLRRKCVDLYVESGFAWREVGSRAHHRQQSGGGALEHIRTTYPIVPGLRVHHVDVRTMLPLNFANHADGTHAVGTTGWTQYIRRLGPGFYSYDPMRTRYDNVWRSRPSDPHGRHRLHAELTGQGLFATNVREYFAFFTGEEGVLRSGDRPATVFRAAYVRDLLKWRALVRGPAREWRTAKETPALQRAFVRGRLAFYSAREFEMIRGRIAKQRQRFLRTTGIAPRHLRRAVVAWAKSRLSAMLGEAMSIVMDLYAFYRMFGRFTPRERVGWASDAGAADRINKAGCPMEQRNIVYVAGSKHTEDLQALIEGVFGVRPIVVRGSHARGTGKVDRERESADYAEVRATRPLNVF